MQLGARGLARDAQDGEGVGGGGVETGDHVRSGRTGRSDANSDVARRGAGVAVGHVRGPLDVTGENVANAAVLAHRRVERVNSRAGDAERRRDPLGFQHADRCFRRLHLGHDCFLLVFIYSDTDRSDRMIARRYALENRFRQPMITGPLASCSGSRCGLPRGFRLHAPAEALSCSTRKLLVVPARPNGTPDTTMSRSLGFANSSERACNSASWLICSKELTLSERTLCAPQRRESWRETRSSGVTARIGTSGRLRAIRAAVVPLEVNATIAAALVTWARSAAAAATA